MKKSIKLMALGLAIVPSALALSACGEKVNPLDIYSGNYTEVASTSEEYEAFIQGLDETGVFDINSIADGGQLKLKLNASSTAGGFDLNVNSKMVIKDATSGSFECKSKGETKITGSITDSGTSQKSNVDYTILNYYYQNKTYYDLTDVIDYVALVNQDLPAKFYTVVAEGETNDPLPYLDFKLASLFQYFTGEWGQNVIIEKDESQTTLKLKITIKGDYIKTTVNNLFNAEEVSDSEGSESMLNMFSVNLEEVSDGIFYLIIVNGKISQAKASVELNGDVTIKSTEGDPESDVTIDVKADIEAEITGFNDEISFPSFEGYVEYKKEEVSE